MSYDKPGNLLTPNFNAESQRPFINSRGEHCIYQNGKPYKLNNNNAVLRYDEWKDIDTTVVDVAVDRLLGISDLRARGLTHSIGSVGKTMTQWEKASGMTDASINMDGQVRSEYDRKEYEKVMVPLPVISKDFQIDWRTLAASRDLGESLDMSQIADASRVVSEKSEDILFSGSEIQVAGHTIYGYFTQPQRNKVTMPTPWDQIATSNNETIIAQVSEALNKARLAKYHGPFNIYVPQQYETKLDEDYRDLDQRTIRDRIEELSGVNQVKVADRIEGDNVAVVQMTSNVVDLAITQDVTTVQWSTHGDMINNFKVMAIWAPRVKADFNDNSGIVQIGTSV